MKNKLFCVVIWLPLLLISCTVAQPGTIYVKQRLGKLDPRTRIDGLILVNPLTTKLIVLPTRTTTGELRLSLPSKEGLNVLTEVSILFKIKPKEVINIIQNLGAESDYSLVIKNTFRSAAADITAKYLAKDMHSGKRDEIELEVREKMAETLAPRGIDIEAVLLKSIELPTELYAAVENKLKAEQEAQRMEFVLQTARQEAEKKRIEAEGIRDAQIIIQEGMTDNNIAWRSLEVLQELAASPNAKLIITDGQAPVLINE
ncbi:MAG: spfh domain, band 7 family protein [Crocinitomicaceae bacterium]|nr:spfh domain, band 7 family protein [Crocinitomicaceae bacterium]|tara:strand:- start:3068 stop:3844 length:777 start_codon:yes stop_codon:yes gene_type:complete